MSFPASRRPASYATSTYHYLINDEALCQTIPFNLNEPLIICCYDCWIEPKLLLAHPEKPKDHGHKLQPIFIDIKFFRCDLPKPVKLPYPHERSTDGKAQDEATTILGSEHFSSVSPKIKPCL